MAGTQEALQRATNAQETSSSSAVRPRTRDSGHGHVRHSHGGLPPLSEDELQPHRQRTALSHPISKSSGPGGLGPTRAIGRDGGRKVHAGPDWKGSCSFYRKTSFDGSWHRVQNSHGFQS